MIDPALLRAAALENKAWPYEEARKLLTRTGVTTPDKGFILFETGYGPSGLPHIGTFGEVARTTMVRHAFRELSDIPTRLLCFSDDMDGLRKVPDNVPNRALLAEHLGKPLTQVPDPFEQYASFGAQNNARLRAFLDAFSFDYEFASATDYYQSGRFDATLRAVLTQYDAIMAVMLPTLGAERQATYAPILPLCPKTGIVLQVPLTAVDPQAATVSYLDPNDGELMTVSALGGACKLQWKADWAMRWVALGVDYEMAGKDLIDSVTLSSKIARILGAKPPEGFNFELFLDEKGQKISKSKGNGLSIEDWLTYASPESLALYMYQAPRKAKRLYFDVIPKAVDDYYQFRTAYPRQELAEKLGNPVHHIHSGSPPEADLGLSFSLLLNLVSAANTGDRATLWGFISRAAPGVSAQTHPELDTLVGYALRYYTDFVAPTKQLRAPTQQEAAALQALDLALETLPAADQHNGDAIMTLVYTIGRDHGFEPMRAWFGTLYECLLGATQGPRMGSFIALYGVAETRTLIAAALGK